MSDALRVPHRMTVAEFQAWLPPPEQEDRRWNLGTPLRAFYATTSLAVPEPP